jgi:hypothetical protein
LKENGLSFHLFLMTRIWMKHSGFTVLLFLKFIDIFTCDGRSPGRPFHLRINCGKQVINGEMGYKCQPNDAPIRLQPNPQTLAENDILAFDEPGRGGGAAGHGTDSPSHHSLPVSRES